MQCVKYDHFQMANVITEENVKENHRKANQSYENTELTQKSSQWSHKKGSIDFFFETINKLLSDSFTSGFFIKTSSSEWDEWRTLLAGILENASNGLLKNLNIGASYVIFNSFGKKGIDINCSSDFFIMRIVAYPNLSVELPEKSSNSSFYQMQYKEKSLIVALKIDGFVPSKVALDDINLKLDRISSDLPLFYDYIEEQERVLAEKSPRHQKGDKISNFGHQTRSNTSSVNGKESSKEIKHFPSLSKNPNETLETAIVKSVINSALKFKFISKKLASPEISQALENTEIIDRLCRKVYYDLQNNVFKTERVKEDRRYDLATKPLGIFASFSTSASPYSLPFSTLAFIAFILAVFLVAFLLQNRSNIQ